MLDLLRTSDLTKAQSDQLRVIYNSGDFLLSIINDILEFSKIESGKLQSKSQFQSPREFRVRAETMATSVFRKESRVQRFHRSAFSGDIRRGRDPSEASADQFDRECDQIHADRIGDFRGAARRERRGYSLGRRFRNRNSSQKNLARFSILFHKPMFPITAGTADRAWGLRSRNRSSRDGGKSRGQRKAKGSS